MGLRSLIKRVADKFSGEYSAAQSDIRADEGPRPDAGPTTVTRARLKRPMDAKEESAERSDVKSDDKG
ncbi:MAG: hypothetical protein EXR69_07875 [Myxococcales bacterium]|nr:hypothetical protein [Myxococcales bacterium]